MLAFFPVVLIKKPPTTAGRNGDTKKDAIPDIRTDLLDMGFGADTDRDEHFKEQKIADYLKKAKAIQDNKTLIISVEDKEILKTFVENLDTKDSSLDEKLDLIRSEGDRVIKIEKLVTTNNSSVNSSPSVYVIRW